jgi:5-methylcytosine-specific restriction endonuclease McrA
MPGDPLFSTPEWRRLRLLVLDRDSWLCQMRGPTCTRYATQVDHIVARADGGARLDPNNCRAACAACNGRAAAMRTNTRRAAFTYRTTLADYVTRF